MRHGVVMIRSKMCRLVVAGAMYVAGSSLSSLAQDSELVTGQGEMVFTWDKELTAAFPEDGRLFEPKMHGGFGEDPETGIVYTGVPGYGFCSISADLKIWSKIGDDARFKKNIHGITVFKHKGKTLIALAQQGEQQILVLEPDGKVLQAIKRPVGTEFNFAPANTYYSGDKVKFSVTDVTYMDGKMYAVTGYSPGDFVLTLEETDGNWSWGSVAWGGKGTAPGQFKTAHGVHAHDGFIFVANREGCSVEKFTADGKHLETLSDIPEGSRVCNVAHSGETFIFCPLLKVGDQSSAPIYAHTGDKLVSTIIAGDLKVPGLTNIHHAWPHMVKNADGTSQLYILVHGWNKGKYAVLKQQK